MSLFHDAMDPGGRILAHRLAQLRSTLENLCVRLRSTIVNALGETIGGIVRDTALHVLDEITRYLPRSHTSAFSQRLRHRLAESAYAPDRSDWADEESEQTDYLEDPPMATSPQRLPTALATGLSAAAWWLSRWVGQGCALSTVTVGLLATTAAYFGGPWVAAVLNLAGTVTQVTTLADALGTEDATLHYDDPY